MPRIIARPGCVSCLCVSSQCLRVRHHLSWFYITQWRHKWRRFSRSTFTCSVLSAFTVSSDAGICKHSLVLVLTIRTDGGILRVCGVRILSVFSQWKNHVMMAVCLSVCHVGLDTVMSLWYHSDHKLSERACSLAARTCQSIILIFRCALIALSPAEFLRYPVPSSSLETLLPRKRLRVRREILASRGVTVGGLGLATHGWIDVIYQQHYTVSDCVWSDSATAPSRQVVQVGLPQFLLVSLPVSVSFIVNLPINDNQQWYCHSAARVACYISSSSVFYSSSIAFSTSSSCSLFILLHLLYHTACHFRSISASERAVYWQWFVKKCGVHVLRARWMSCVKTCYVRLWDILLKTRFDCDNVITFTSKYSGVLSITV